MINLDFKNWFFKEGAEIFGFEPIAEPSGKKSADNDPISSFDVHRLMDLLMLRNVGNKAPVEDFVNEVHWGEGYGKIRLRTGTGLNVLLERLSSDLEGNPIWTTKRCWQINREGYGGHEEIVCEDLYKELININQLSVDSPKREYKDLEYLTLTLSDKLQRTAHRIFAFDKIKRINENNYIISFNVNGGEAPDHRRVLSNYTNLSYNENTGVIRVINTNVESPIGKAPTWEIMPSDSDMSFLPTQSPEEIAECVAVMLKYY